MRIILLGNFGLFVKMIQEKRFLVLPLMRVSIFGYSQGGYFVNSENCSK